MIIGAFLLLLMALVALGVPIAFGLGLATLGTAFAGSDINNLVLARQSLQSAGNYTLLAVPFFMLTGILMNSLNVTTRLVRVVGNVLGRVPGALAHVTVIVSLFMAGMSGSAVADVTALGSTLIPMMRAAGYDGEYSAALVAASAAIGPILPPSIHMIIYASVAQVSIGKLFLAGLLPGVLLGLTFFVASHFALRHRYALIREHTELITAGIGLRTSFIDAAPSIVIPIIVFGGIFSGYTTITESAVLATAMILLLGWTVYRPLDRRMLFGAAFQTSSRAATVFVLVGLAGAYGWVLSVDRIQDAIIQTFLGLTHDRNILLFLIDGISLLMGVVFDPAVHILLITPAFLPLAVKLGLDPIQFGVIVVLSAAIGFVTPPVGITLMLANSMAGGKILRTVRQLMPYYVVNLVVLLIVTYVPAVSEALPSLFAR